MRIPPSVIVMSLVTAVPFALAVRDTMKPHPKTYDEMTDQEREAQFEEEMRKDAAEQQKREAAEAAQREATYKTFFGEKPAQLGSYFATVHLGMPTDEDAFDTLAGTTAVSAINFESRNELDAIRISDDEHCDALHAALIAAWSDSNDAVYLDPANHQRAAFRDCTVTFDRFIDVNAWIDRKGDVPISLATIGMSADKLREQLGDRVTQDDGEIVMWEAPGIGRGEGATHITARIENNKIAGLSINVVTDAPTMDAVQARLDGLLGKGAANLDDDVDAVIYKGKLPARLVRADGTLSLDLGN